MTVRIQGVHPVLMCSDLSASIRFYAGLGFQLQFQDDPAQPRYAAIRRDGVELHLQWADASQWAHPVDRPVYRFLATDTDALYREFDQAQALPASSASPWAKPSDTPWGTREFHLRDPDGNGLQFYRML